MERHRVKGGEREERRSKNEHLKPLGDASLALASGEAKGSVNVVEDIKPGDTKRFAVVWGAPTPRKKGSAGKSASPAKNPAKKKESAGKSVGRPASSERKKRTKRSL